MIDDFETLLAACRGTTVFLDKMFFYALVGTRVVTPVPRKDGTIGFHRSGDEPLADIVDDLRLNGVRLVTADVVIRQITETIGKAQKARWSVGPAGITITYAEPVSTRRRERDRLFIGVALDGAAGVDRLRVAVNLLAMSRAVSADALQARWGIATLPVPPLDAARLAEVHRALRGTETCGRCGLTYPAGKERGKAANRGRVPKQCLPEHDEDCMVVLAVATAGGRDERRALLTEDGGVGRAGTAGRLPVTVLHIHRSLRRPAAPARTVH